MKNSATKLSLKRPIWSQTTKYGNTDCEYLLKSMKMLIGQLNLSITENWDSLWASNNSIIFR